VLAVEVHAFPRILAELARVVASIANGFGSELVDALWKPPRAVSAGSRVAKDGVFLVIVGGRGVSRSEPCPSRLIHAGAPIRALARKVVSAVVPAEVLVANVAVSRVNRSAPVIRSGTSGHLVDIRVDDRRARFVGDALAGRARERGDAVLVEAIRLLHGDARARARGGGIRGGAQEEQSKYRVKGHCQKKKRYLVKM